MAEHRSTWMSQTGPQGRRNRPKQMSGGGRVQEFCAKALSATAGNYAGSYAKTKS